MWTVINRNEYIKIIKNKKEIIYSLDCEEILYIHKDGKKPT